MSNVEISKSRVIRGYISLLLATLFWGSTFPIIKIVVCNIGSFSYTWIRSMIAITCLLPYVVYRVFKKSVEKFRREIFGGLVTGIAYALGLWLQGWGTGLTTASNSAFITELNVVFVHIYVALIERRYSIFLGIELLLAILGLYLLTLPTGGFNLGDFLVLLGAVAWAAQVILVSKFSDVDPLCFTFFEMIPASLFIISTLFNRYTINLTVDTILGLTYLGTVCTVGAFSLQVYGQRFVYPEVAALIYLLEPAFAAIFAWLMLGEIMKPLQILGAILILISMIIAIRTQKY